MDLACGHCGAVPEPGASFCSECGRPLGASAEVVLEVETHRPHVRGSLCQLRLRATRVADADCDVTVRLLLHGRGKYVEQEPSELEQYCRLGRRGEPLVLSFPFRPGIAGDLPVETLRVVVTPAGKPEEGVAFECPDRSFFVRIDEEGHRQGAGVRIEGGIHLDFSQLKEMYGSDVKDLLSFGLGNEAASAPECRWEPIALRPAGAEQRTACGFGQCGRPVAADQGLACSRCRKTVCRKHEDESVPGHCKLCAEAVRQDAFTQKAKQVDSSRQPEALVHAINRVAQPRPTFSGRIWTDRSNRPTSRDIVTVPRTSRDWFRIGERFTLNAQTDRDCYLTLLDLGTSGQVYVLLENYRLRTGAPVGLNGPDESREWVVGSPPGIERIRALFTLQPLDVFAGVGPFALLDPQGRADKAIERLRSAGLALERMPPDTWTDAGCEFVVVEA